MSPSRNGLPAYLIEPIEIGRDPRITDEATMRKYRIVIEDDETGQEYAGFSGLSRRKAEEISELIKLKGDHDLTTGRLPPRRADESPPARIRTRGRR